MRPSTPNLKHGARRPIFDLLAEALAHAKRILELTCQVLGNLTFDVPTYRPENVSPQYKLGVLGLRKIVSNKKATGSIIKVYFELKTFTISSASSFIDLLHFPTFRLSKIIGTAFALALQLYSLFQHLEISVSYITTRDKIRLYVKDWGSGRPVILIHGWPLSADSWDDQALAIADSGMRAIAYDRRGFGRSDQPWAGYNYDTLVDDLAAVIEATGAVDATLVGFSMGGGEVARYLSRHAGKNVVQAALISSIVPYMLKTSDNPHGVPQTTFDEMTTGMKKDRAHFFAGFFKDFFGVSMLSHPISNELLEWACNVSMQAGLKPTLACAGAFATTDFRSDLSAFNKPTLIIHGTADKTVPVDATARAAARAIPHAKLIEYEGAPHGIFATHKQQLTTDLLAFLRNNNA